MIHAVRSKPVVVGAASTVGPYFCTNACSTRLSLSPRVTAAMQFVAHAVGVGAADVVAFEQDLSAAADAHELMAEFVEASGGVAGAGEGEHSGSQDRAVEDAAEGRIEFGRINFDFRSCILKTLQISDC